MRSRTIITPVQITDLATTDDPLVFWKHVLPEAPIIYNDGGESRRIDFSADNWLGDLKTAFDDKALDQTPFVVAKDHDEGMLADKVRGEVLDVRKYEDLPKSVRGQNKGGAGLWTKIKMHTAEAAEMVKNNPRLGVSARLREGVERAVDGKTFKRAMIHVLATLDPKITGLKSWTPATDFASSYDADDVLDLSTAAYTEAPVAPTATGTKRGVTKNDDGTFAFDDELLGEHPELVDEFSDDEIQAFLVANGVKPSMGDADTDDDSADDDSDDDDSDDDDSDDTDTGDTGLSTKDRRDIALANSRATQALAELAAANKRTAEAEFDRFRDLQLSKGVPPWVLDSAKPIIARHRPMVIDLSNTGEANLDVTAVVRKLVEGYEGTIDLSRVEAGHGGSESGAADPDEELFALADADPRLRF